MSRFFFDVHNGIFLPDNTGTELPSLNDAYTEAIKTAGRLLQESGMDLLAGAPWRMEVTDNHGQLLLTLNFSAEIARQTLMA